MPALARQALAEALGSAGLVCTVIGSGIAASRLSADPGLQLLENALVTGLGLVALILAFGPVSGGHFNPLVTLADRVHGGVSTTQVLAYLPAQLAGGVLGAMLANLMFDLPAISISTTQRSGSALWLSEALATFGLIALIFALVRTGQARLAPFAVGAYIAGAYWWSSSTSFANPMIDVARTLSDTFAGIAPASVPMFILAQVLGAAAAVAAIGALYPTTTAQAAVPHQPSSKPKEPTMSDRPAVLFVCVHNAGRSQMAAALLDHHAAGRVDVRSAGSAPTDTINPTVLEAMTELGIDLRRESPKPLTTEAVEASDIVITMGCGDACPIYPGKRYLDWTLDDPAGQDLPTVRRIRDQIAEHVQHLLAELLAGEPRAEPVRRRQS